MSKFKSPVLQIGLLILLTVGLYSCGERLSPVTPTSGTVAVDIPKSSPTTIAPQIAASPTYSPTVMEFEGYYTRSFEVSAFVPSDMKVKQVYVEGFGYRGLEYWLTALPESGFQEQYETHHSQVVAATGQDGYYDYPITVYVRFIGELSPTVVEIGEGYGHMAYYTNEITVNQLLEMKIPIRPTIEEAITNSLERWARRPYQNEIIDVVENDGTLAKVRIIAQFRESPDSEWTTKAAVAECHKFENGWLCDGYFSFEEFQ